MAELTYILHILKKMWFMALSIGLATCLLVVSTNLATNNYADPSALGRDVENNFAHMRRVVGNGMRTFGHVPGSVVHSAAHALNVRALITPASSLPVPTIATATTPPVQATLSPAPTSQAVSATSASPQPSIKLEATGPVHFATANTYAWGNCTWWAAQRRAQQNDPIPNSWGNAATWAARASRDGYAVDHRPSTGAIMQTPYSAGGLGHVAYVEGVDPDGSWHISEMNVLGLNVVDHKSLPPGAAAIYSFIHDKI